MRKRGIVVLRERLEYAERQEAASTRDVTSADGPRRLREFARYFIDEIRRYDHSNRYNPHKFQNPVSGGRPT